jgi:hypothetical protein
MSLPSIRSSIKAVFLTFGLSLYCSKLVSATVEGARATPFDSAQGPAIENASNGICAIKIDGRRAVDDGC